jgi:hypothetical protein
MNTELLAKIRKLLTLADVSRGATEAEARSAFEHAQRLMIEHGISEAQVEVEDEHAASLDLSEEYVETENIRETNYSLLALRILTQCFGVRVIRHRGKAKAAFTILGERANVELARFAYGFLCESMQRGYREYLKASGLRAAAGLRNGYFLGVYRGFTDAHKKAKEEAKAQNEAGYNAYAVAVVNKEAIVAKFVSDRFPRLRKGRSASFRRIDGGAYEAGQRDGAGLNVRRPLAGAASAFSLRAA